MTHTKRIFSFSLALLMLFTCLFGMTTSASAASSLSKVKNVKATVKVTKTDDKIGIWNIYVKEPTLKWSKVSGADGYEIYINKNGQKKYTVTTTNTTLQLNDHCVHGPGAGLNIYPYYTVRVRAYEVVNGKTVYGPWSSWKIIWM